LVPVRTRTTQIELDDTICTEGLATTPQVERALETKGVDVAPASEPDVARVDDANKNTTRARANVTPSVLFTGPFSHATLRTSWRPDRVARRGWQRS
jgi:hypothetical protein